MEMTISCQDLKTGLMAKGSRWTVYAATYRVPYAIGHEPSNYTLYLVKDGLAVWVAKVILNVSFNGMV